MCDQKCGPNNYTDLLLLFAFLFFNFSQNIHRRDTSQARSDSQTPRRLPDRAREIRRGNLKKKNRKKKRQKQNNI